jgi:hypothetical protein
MEGALVDTRDHWTCAGIVLAIAFVALVRHARASAGPAAPAYEDATQSSEYSVWHPGTAPGGVQHAVGNRHNWVARDVKGAVVVRHRYPQAIGSNASALIKFGWAPLKASMQDDQDWFSSRPSTVMW